MDGSHPDPETEHDAFVSDPLRIALVVAVAGSAVVMAATGRAATAPFARTAGPFTSVGIAVAAGWALVRLGVFCAIERRLRARWRPSTVAAIVTVLLGTALLSAAVNLDVAAVAVMPFAMTLAARRRLDAGRLAVAVAVTANAASILLPTSNVTNLLVIDGGPLSDRAFLEASWGPWLLVVATTVGCLTWFVGRSVGDRTLEPPAGRWSLRRVGFDLTVMYVLASELRAVLPGGVAFGATFLAQAGGATVLAAVVNNLPAAAALHATTVGAAWGGVVAAAIGPNLLLTGSVATILCRRLARESGADLPASMLTRVGVVLVPLQLLVAWLGLLLAGGVSR